MAKLTRAERYKRNYRLVRNTYNDAELAKRARTWSDKRLYSELGIETSNVRKPPKLRNYDDSREAYFKRKLDHFRYARQLGLEVPKAKKVWRFKKEKIKTTLEYQRLKQAPHSYDNRSARADQYGDWISRKAFPPELQAMAKKFNAEVNFNPEDKYGYVKAHFWFIENLDLSKEADRQRLENYAKPDYFDKYRVIYSSEIRVIN